MATLNHWCRGCRTAHDAALWYYQPTKGGRWYICGEGYDVLTTKTEWREVNPHDPIETSDSQIKYCYYCDTPIGGIRQWEQGYHDTCAAAAKPTKKRRGPVRRGRSGGRRVSR